MNRKDEAGRNPVEDSPAPLLMVQLADAADHKEAAPAPQRTGTPRRSTDYYRSTIAVVKTAFEGLNFVNRQVDDGAGLQDGYFAHAVSPDSRSGRQASWPMLQLMIDLLARHGVRIVVSAEKCEPGAAVPENSRAEWRARQSQHWRTSAYYRELGTKGQAALKSRIDAAKHFAKLGRASGRARRRRRRQRTRDQRLAQITGNTRAER